MANAPGQCRTLKSTGSRESQQVVEEFAVDIGLVDQECDYLQHIATELGEWNQVIEHGGKVAASPELIALASPSPRGLLRGGKQRLMLAPSANRS